MRRALLSKATAPSPGRYGHSAPSPGASGIEDASVIDLQRDEMSGAKQIIIGPRCASVVDLPTADAFRSSAVKLTT